MYFYSIYSSFLVLDNKNIHVHVKGGYVFFQKCFRKLSRAQYQNKLVANQQ